MNTRINTTAGALLTLSVLSGCAQTSGHWDRNFGTSLRASLASQVADPAAARNPDPVQGIDGGAAAASHKRYETSFAAPAAQQSLLSGK